MWLLIDEVRTQIQKARDAGIEITAAQMAVIDTSAADNGKMVIVGDDAIIPIEGVLTEKRDYMAAWFGGGNTLYPDIIDAINSANADKSVKQITLSVGSCPGGNITGMFPAMDAIAESGKPVRAHVKNMAASAGFGLVSQAGEIIASGRSTQLGSVGVAIDTYVFDGDVKEISISSTNAPKKRPDLTTDEGKAVVREQLDAIHDLFADAIASGRGTTVGNVNKNYGQGAIVLAQDALKAGMIDSIADAADKNKQSTTPKGGGSQQTANGGEGTEARMDLNTLKADHPAVYAEAVEAGVKQERDRVEAHLTLGKQSGDMSIAVEAIESGAEMTMKLTAQYMAAGMKIQDTKNRQEDNTEVSTAVGQEVVDAQDAEIAALMDGEQEQDGVWLGEEQA